MSTISKLLDAIRGDPMDGVGETPPQGISPLDTADGLAREEPGQAIETLETTANGPPHTPVRDSNHKYEK
jgi:hypothetical protein